MSSKKLLSEIAAFVTAAAISVSLCGTVFAAKEDSKAVNAVQAEEDYPEDTLMDEEPESAPEADPEKKAEKEPAASEEPQAVAGGSNDERTVTVPARAIKPKPLSKKIYVGETFTITYTLKPLRSDDIISFHSYNKSIASVTDDGVVTGVRPGKTAIRLKGTKGEKISVEVEVLDNPHTDESVSGIKVLDENIMLRKGKTAEVQYLLYPLGAQDTVKYSSSNTSVAQIDENGVITAVGTGSAVITMTAAAAGVSGECYVTVYSGVYKGIDVSKWQGDINWNKVSKSGVDFAMIRSSFGDSNVDVKLKQNVAGCEKYGIPYGFYHYTYASSVSEAKKEARYFMRNIRNYNPKYPVVLDIEEDMYKKMSRKKVTDIICAFMGELENAGYYAMVYSYSNFFNDCTDMKRLKSYDIWVACWGDSDRLESSYDHHYGMWQYSCTGKIGGIDGDVDLDYAYKNYASVIKKAGLNNPDR